MVAPVIPMVSSHGAAALSAAGQPMAWPSAAIVGPNPPQMSYNPAQFGVEGGSRALSLEECKQFDVPIGTVWKESAAQRSSNAITSREARTGLRERSFIRNDTSFMGIPGRRPGSQADTAQSPVMYGGYMPMYMSNTSPVNNSKHTDMWQA
jgi:hypothetical protein